MSVQLVLLFCVSYFLSCLCICIQHKNSLFSWLRTALQRRGEKERKSAREVEREGWMRGEVETRGWESKEKRRYEVRDGGRDSERSGDTLWCERSGVLQYDSDEFM